VPIAIKENTSLRFAWEGSDAKHSKARKRSSVGAQQLSSAARKMATCTPAEPRSSFQENGGRSTPKGCHSASQSVRSVQMRAKKLSANPQTTKPHTTTLERRPTSSKRPPMKSVQSRGTQLDSTPIPHDARIRSPSSVRTPRILRQLEKTPLESASIAWSYFRSPSVVGQTPDPDRRQPDQMPLDESSGNKHIF